MPAAVPAMTGREQQMIRGECNCGAVAFEVDAEVPGLFVCHCSICRRATGSQGIAVIVVDNGAFRWVRGEAQVSTWKKPGTDWQIWFCPACGSPVPGANDEDRMFVPAGLITSGGESLKVIHHVWVGSKAPWDEIVDDGEQHLEGFRGQSEGSS
jgi:hypothetical protein